MDDLGRRVLAFGVVCGVPLMLALAVARAEEDPVVRWAYPPVMVYLLVFAWVLVRRPARAAAMTRTSLLILDVVWLLAITVRLDGAGDATEGWAQLFPMSFMGIVVFVAIGFLDRSVRLAVLHAGVLVGLAVATTLAGLLRLPGGEAYVVDLLRYAVYLVVLVVVLTVMSRWRERVAEAVEDARHAQAAAVGLRDMAYLDELTGIANRRRLVEELSHQADLVGPGHPVSVVYFDLDRFKAINDTLGHAVGDHVLRVVADVASRVVRDLDVLARLGGEEFVVVLPGSDAGQAVQLAERLRRTLPDELEVGVGVRLTASFGVTDLRPGESATSVLGRVDMLMYRAKNDGRDRVMTS
jgi:diguanylate cyclase (GGDEF)-like protein